MRVADVFYHRAPASIAGRVKAWVKSLAPSWAWASLRRVKAAGTDVLRQVRVWRMLSAPFRSRYLAMYRESERLFECGITQPPLEPILVPVGRFPFDVWVRPDSSDVLVYDDVFIKDYYGHLRRSDVCTIIDCGANIGLGSVFLLAKYPGARLIGLEPDPVNVALCRRNLTRFGSRSVILNEALWGQSGTLRLAASELGTWASHVVVGAADDGVAVACTGMKELIRRYDIGAIDFLKIDIEGAERQVFASPDLEWLDCVQCLAIELHDAECEREFEAAISRYPFELRRYGELVYAYRLSPAD